MEQSKSIGQERKGTHLTKSERVVIEWMLVPGHQHRGDLEPTSAHCEREIVRETVEHIDTQLQVKLVYSSERGQDVYDKNAPAKGPQLKPSAAQRSDVSNTRSTTTRAK